MEIHHTVIGACKSCESTYSENITCIGPTGKYRSYTNCAGIYDHGWQNQHWEHPHT